MYKLHHYHFYHLSRPKFLANGQSNKILKIVWIKKRLYWRFEYQIELQLKERRESRPVCVLASAKWKSSLSGLKSRTVGQGQICRSHSTFLVIGQGQWWRKNKCKRLKTDRPIDWLMVSDNNNDWDIEWWKLTLTINGTMNDGNWQ